MIALNILIENLASSGVNGEPFRANACSTDALKPANQTRGYREPSNLVKLVNLLQHSAMHLCCDSKSAGEQDLFRSIRRYTLYYSDDEVMTLVIPGVSQNF